MSGTQPEKAPKTGSAESSMGGQTASILTISSNFPTGASASLDMSGINDMGGDTEVDIYAATGTEPTTRQSGTTNRRYSRAPAPAAFPTTLNGGSWTGGTRYWVQVIDNVGGTKSTYQGSIVPTAAGGTLNITLNKKTY